jgi:hypothetical protein
MVKLLMLDIRSHDELATHRFSLEKIRKSNVIDVDILNIPVENIKYNVDYINKLSNEYEQVRIVCRYNVRASFIKNKYFENNQKIIINPDGHFGQDDFDKNLEFTIKSSDKHYNSTQRLQFIFSFVILIVVFLAYKYDMRFLFILVALALYHIYTAYTKSCKLLFMLSKKYDW